MSDIQVSGTTFNDFREFVKGTEVVITPYFSGFVNIDGGSISIAGRLFPQCDVCNGYSNTSVFVNCNECGRNHKEYIHLRSGDGDGVYPVYELSWDGTILGSISFYDRGNSFAQGFSSIPDGISDGSLPTNAAIEYFWEYFNEIDTELELDYISTISAVFDPVWSSQEDPFGTYYFADAGVGEDPRNTVVTVKDIRLGSQDVYVFSERDPHNLNVLIPRVILTLDTHLAQEIGMPSGQLKLDLDEEADLWANSTVAAQIGSNASAAIATNLKFESSLLGSGYWDEYSENDHTLIMFSWRVLFQLLNSDAENLTDEIFANLSPQQVALVHQMRGLVSLGSTYFNFETQEIGPGYRALQEEYARSNEAESDLPTASNGLGSGKKIGSSQKTQRAKFCSSCGSAFADESQNFCSTCGSARN